MSKIGKFWRGIANDISKVHVRAAFSDVEKRIGHFFGHHEAQEPKEEPKEDKPEKKPRKSLTERISGFGRILNKIFEADDE